MGEEKAGMGSTIATASNSDQTEPANVVEEAGPRKERERTPTNSATSTAISSFWSAKPSKSTPPVKEKQKSVVNLVLGDSDELTDQSDDDEEPDDVEERSEVAKDLKEEDDENEYREILKRKSICQNCERDGRADCVLAPRIGRYPRCVRCRDKDWRCSFLPTKNGEFPQNYKKAAHHHKPTTHFPIDVDVKPVISKISKDPPPPVKAHRGPGRPPKNRNAQAGPSKLATSTARVVPYDRSLRPHLPSSSRTAIPQATFSQRAPPSSRTTAGGLAPNSSPLANRSTSSASNLLRRAAHNALAAEEGAGVDNQHNSQLLDALSKMSRALRLSSEAFQLLADYQRGKPPNNESRDGRGAQGAPMVLE